MLKKIMFYLMVLTTVSKCGALAFICFTDFERLPVMVYLSAGAIVLWGGLLIGKSFVKPVFKRELAVYYGATAFSVIFNLVIMKIFSRAELTMLDFTLIGTFMDVLICVVFVVLTIRESRYVRIEMKSDT